MSEPEGQTLTWDDQVADKLERLSLRSTDKPTATTATEEKSETSGASSTTSTSNISTTPTTSPPSSPALTATPCSPPPTRLDRPTTNLSCTISIHTSPKTQHFSQYITIFAFSVTTSSENSQPILQDIAQIQARHLNITRLRALQTKSFRHSTSFSKSLSSLNTSGSDAFSFALQCCEPDGSLKWSLRETGYDEDNDDDGREWDATWGENGMVGYDEISTEGEILVLGLVLVEKEWRRKGMGRWLIERLVERKKAVKWVVVKPMVVRGDFSAELRGLKGAELEEKRVLVEERELRNALAFYRSVGFQRLGASGWWAMKVTRGEDE